MLVRLTATAAVLLGLLLGMGRPAAAAPGTRKLPPTMPLCKKNDPRLNDCIKDAITTSLPDLVKGLPALGVPPIDPLHVPLLRVDNGQGSVNIKLSISDFIISRISNLRLTDAQIDLDKPKMHFEADLDQLKVDGPYKIDGKVLLLPLTGEGPANFTLDNAHYALDMDGKFIQKHGRRYLDVDGFAFKAFPGKLTIRLENLFNGDKALGKQMNQFLNENSDDILAELLAPLEEAFGESLKYIAKRLFSKVPFDDIFLD